MPLTFTSLINGSEMFPSVLTTAVWETSGSFQTLTRITSESPTIYPGGTSTGGLASVVLAESAVFAVSAGFAASEAAGSGDLRLASCVCDIRVPAPASQQITTRKTICFLNENMLRSDFSVKVRFHSRRGIIAFTTWLLYPEKLSCLFQKL